MKDIENYEGRYAATEDGQIWSYKSNKFLKQSPDTKGYSIVTLYKDGTKKSHSVHRLIAETFLPNPNSLPEVNHLDENKTNNSVNNLQWTTRIENNNYGTRAQRASEHQGKPVLCIELNENFPNAAIASRELKIDRCGIGKCCRGEQKTCGGYHFKFVEVSNAS